MVAALVQSIAREFLVALNAEELNYTGKKLPEEVLPGDFLGSEREDEFIEVEIFVGDMGRLYFTMGINENLTLLTKLPATLTSSKELATVSAPL